MILGRLGIQGIIVTLGIGLMAWGVTPVTSVDMMDRIRGARGLGGGSMDTGMGS